MNSLREVITRWLDAAMPHRQGPQIGRVLQSGSGGGAGKYSVQVRILRPGSLDETGRILDEVPISPVWAGTDGRGIYVPPPEDALVLVDYIEHDPAHPFVAGIWGEHYDAAPFEAGELTIVGNGVSITVKDDEIYLNGDGLGGLIKIEELRNELAKNVGMLTAMKGVFDGAPIMEPGNMSPSLLQMDLKGALAGKNPGEFGDNIENIRIKHG